MARFKNLRKLVAEENQQLIEEKKNYILNVGCGYAAYATEKRMEQYSKGLITLDKLKEYACKRMKKQYEKELNETLARIEQIENAELPNTITIHFYWTYTVWYICHAEVYIDGRYYEGVASGCGYDKKSTAVSQCFNKDHGIMKYLYIEKDKRPDISNRELLGYGTGCRTLPYFEDGVGMDCFVRILKNLGFNYQYVYSKQGDTYIFTREVEG